MVVVEVLVPGFASTQLAAPILHGFHRSHIDEFKISPKQTGTDGWFHLTSRASPIAPPSTLHMCIHMWSFHNEQLQYQFRLKSSDVVYTCPLFHGKGVNAPIAPMSKKSKHGQTLSRRGLSYVLNCTLLIISIGCPYSLCDHEADLDQVCDGQYCV